MKPTEQPETTSPPIDTPSKGDAQPVDVETDVVHCVECLWWASDESADKGKCHRHAPRDQVILTGRRLASAQTSAATPSQSLTRRRSRYIDPVIFE